MATAAEEHAGAGARLTWRDPAVRWLLLAAFLLLCASLARQRGYPLADAVEYMDRAQAWVAGDTLSETRSVRSFAFSAFFVPPFLAARFLGLEDLRPVLWVARALQVALALGLLLACVRLAERVAGRSAGLAVGWVCALNPLVLQYGVQPVSAIATSLCVALGLERLILRGTKRDARLGGLWFGLAFLMAYQSLLVALAVFAALLARDRWKHRASWVALALGIAGAMLVQLALDRLVYGTWQGSLYRYLLENIGFVIVNLLLDLRQVEAAGDLYAQISALRGNEFVRDESVTRATMRFPALWYLVSAPRFFVWPVLAILVAGIARAALRPRWTSSLALVALALALFVMSKKGDKSLRLCLPLLPLCVPLLALGWDWLAARTAPRLLARAALLAAVPLAFAAFDSLGPRAYAAYWDAAQWIAAQLPPGSARARCASAYDWAVFLRFGPGVERVKLSAPLDLWRKLDDGERQRIAAELDSVDWLIVHQPLFAQASLVEVLAARFEVAAAFYDQDEGPALGGVLVLRRADSGGRRLCAFRSDPPAPRFGRALEFRAAPGAPPLLLLGFDLEELPGSGWWWLTHHWELPGTEPGSTANIAGSAAARASPPPAMLAVEPGSVPVEVRDRITAPDEQRTWQNDHALGRGSRVPQGARYLSEGFLFVPSDVAQVQSAGFRALGGAYRRGELLPLRLWLEVRSADRTLATFLPGETESAQASLAASTWRWSAGGIHVSEDGLVEAGGFFLPVHPRAFSRDDGKPLRD